MEAGAAPIVLDPAWYEAIPARRSRRRFADLPLASADVERLLAFCAAFRLLQPVRVELIKDASADVFTGLAGSYGRVDGARWVAAFVGPADSELEIGYAGEAFILEATRLGLDTCWIAGSFDKERAGRLVELAAGERVVAITPVGHGLERQPLGERLLRSAVHASSRKPAAELAPGIGDGWPAWAVAAVEAARWAPSGANRQPWRFRLDGSSLVMGRAEKFYWTAPIDFGIAQLHIDLAVAHAGVSGSWERLDGPDVGRFTPAAV
jgi:nitroreductase